MVPLGICKCRRKIWSISVCYHDLTHDLFIYFFYFVVYVSFSGLDIVYNMCVSGILPDAFVFSTQSTDSFASTSNLILFYAGCSHYDNGMHESDSSRSYQRPYMNWIGECWEIYLEHWRYSLYCIMWYLFFICAC